MVEDDYKELTTEEKKMMSQRDIDKYNAIRENSLKEQENEQHNSIR